MQTTGDQLIHTLSPARRLDGREECCAEGSDRDTHTHIFMSMADAWTTGIDVLCDKTKKVPRYRTEVYRGIK